MSDSWFIGDPWSPPGWLCRRCGVFWGATSIGLYELMRKPEQVCAARLHDLVSARIIDVKGKAA